jgi:hypothetical protein
MVYLGVQSSFLSSFLYSPLSLAGTEVATVGQSALRIDLGHFDKSLAPYVFYGSSQLLLVSPAELIDYLLLCFVDLHFDLG